MPVLLVAAVLAGLALALLSTPVLGRGDYGQWLMTARHYSGEDVPQYRVISALPPVLPLTLAAIKNAVGEPALALQLTNVALLFGLGTSIYLLGALLLRDRLGGALSVVAAFLVTDRVFELFAFGALLQIAALTWMVLSVAAFSRAARPNGRPLGWWVAGNAGLVLAALTHVGSAAVAVPVAVAAASLSAVRLRREHPNMLRSLAVVTGASLAIVAVYWLLVIMPASSEYLRNPASLAYRGPDRLLALIVSYWPSVVVMALGALYLVLGIVWQLQQRKISGMSVLLAFAGVTWGSFLASVVAGTSTDYPRFAPLLLLPFAIAFAGVAVGALRRIAMVRAIPAQGRTPTVSVVLVALLIVVSAPLAVSRFARQAAVYQPRDAVALDAAVDWIDANLDDDASVLTSVREGKWLEGKTGRAALFSQPVRYAFRQAEWQRSVDADAVLRTSAMVSNGYFRAMYLGTLTNGRATLPTSLLLGVNHGGEFVDLLTSRPSDLKVHAQGVSVSGSALQPVRSALRHGPYDARLTTVWRIGQDPSDFVRRHLRVWDDGTTVELFESSPGSILELTLRPVAGVAVTSVEVHPQGGTVCFDQVGGSPPCVRITASEQDATFETSDGVLRFRTRTSDQLRLHITALTPGGQATALRALDPAEVVERHNVGAALLYTPDSAAPSRVKRLESVGFRRAAVFGPYQVMLRERSTADSLQK